MRTRKLRLTPQEPYSMAHAKTIGLSGGELPFVLIRLDGGKTVRLNVGQCLPVPDGYDLINPFQRTADVEIVFNAPVAIDFAPKLETSYGRSEAVTYLTSVHLPDLPDTTEKGAAVFQKKGRSLMQLVKVVGAYYDAFYVENYADVFEPLTTALWGESTETVWHESGDTNDNLIMNSGYHAAGALAGSLPFELAVFPDAAVWKPLTTTVSFTTMMPEGSAVFLIGHTDKALSGACKFLDFGVE